MASIIKQIIINKTSIPTLRRMLDLSSLKHKLTASNVANATTPGYRTKSIDFDTELKKVVLSNKGRINLTHPRHIPLGSERNSAPKIKVSEESKNSTGINSVDIDKEMADLAQNQLVFELGAKLAAKKFKALKSAIRGRQL